MKKILVLLCLLTMCLSSYSQLEVNPDKWFSISDTLTFEGTRKSAVVFGTSTDQEFSYPVLSITRLNNESPVVLLSYCPAGDCRELKLFIKFNHEEKMYNVHIRYINPLAQYIIDLNQPNFSYNNFIEKLKNGKEISIKLLNNCFVYYAKFPLDNAEEALKILK
jgi:hypothetical protein